MDNQMPRSKTSEIPTASVKSCPHCHDEYALTDGLTVRRIPIGRKIENLVHPVSMWWTGIFLTSMVLIAAFYHPPSNSTLERGFGWFIVYAPLIPGGILTIISWFFPYVRVYRCRYCGVETEVLLKARPISQTQSDM